MNSNEHQTLIYGHAVIGSVANLCVADAVMRLADQHSVGHWANEASLARKKAARMTQVKHDLTVINELRQKYRGRFLPEQFVRHALENCASLLPRP